VTPLSVLARRQHDGNRLVRRVLVANVDTVLLVMGLDGDWNLRRLERFWTLARGTGLPAVVVLTKADLFDTAAVAHRIREVHALMPDAPVRAVDARGPQAREALVPWLRPGHTLVALGSSGTGKSTLTNALAETLADACPAVAPPGDPPQRQATGATRTGDDRGRHTTTVRSLHRLPGGACLIDTPGVRTLRLESDDDTLAAGFDDIARLAPSCRFRDCRHEGEPGCAVRDGVDPARLRNFHKLQRESRRDSLTLLERQALHATWRARSKASRAAGRRGRDGDG
jgi:ribosome biogenesis GTPase